MQQKHSGSKAPEEHTNKDPGKHPAEIAGTEKEPAKPAPKPIDVGPGGERPAEAGQ